MIVPMKHVTLLCVANERETALDRLREFGGMHLNLKTSDSADFRNAQSRYDAAKCVLRHLENAAQDVPVTPVSGGHHKPLGCEKLLNLMRESTIETLSGGTDEKIVDVNRLVDFRQFLINAAARLHSDIEEYRHFGDFDVSLVQRLSEQGIPVTLFRGPAGENVSAEDAGVMILILDTDSLASYGVMIGAGVLPDTCEIISLPDAPLSELQSCRDAVIKHADKITVMFKEAAKDSSDIEKEITQLADLCNFVTATDAMASDGSVAWITGWLPADQSEAMRADAAEQMWGLLLRNPLPDELPPTLLRPPRLFRPVLALFGALGIAPAYNEADVSVPFFCFFSIFFAMLVGDGGYGALILVLTLWARKRLPAAPRSPFILLSFFACATMVWGFLSNTWFGTHPASIDNPVSLWLNDPAHGLNNTMLVCFTLGVTHLSVARIWNAANLFPDTKFLAQVGWIGVLWFMYCMTCQIIGIFPAPLFIYPIFGISLALIFLFSLKKAELREHGIELGMMPLTIVGCLGDIISYVRLFAVGLASVKVAENFNQMALSLNLPLWAKIVPVVMILLLGHGLNFMMAGLSILVHAVRLNTLEFSNHKGVTWSGYAFRPFKRGAAQTS